MAESPNRDKIIAQSTILYHRNAEACYDNRAGAPSATFYVFFAQGRQTPGLICFSPKGSFL